MAYNKHISELDNKIIQTKDPLIKGVFMPFIYTILKNCYLTGSLVSSTEIQLLLLFKTTSPSLHSGSGV